MSDWTLQTTINLDKISSIKISNMISQCFLINEIYLDNFNLSIPPFVLSSLPFVLKNPACIKNSKGIKYDINSIQSMVDLTFFQPDCIIEYVMPNGKCYTEKLNPCTSLKEMYYTLFSKINLEIDKILLSRSIEQQHILLLPPCDLPIGLFAIPSAKWSVEFKHFPSEAMLNENTIAMIRYWIASRLRMVSFQRSILKEITTKISHFRSKVSERIIKPKDQLEFNNFLQCLSTDKRYRKLVNRSCSLSCGEFILTKENFLEFSSNQYGSFVTNSTDFNINNLPEGKYSLCFNNEHTIILDQINFKALSSILNVYIIDFYYLYEHKILNFEIPIRNSSIKIPRIFTDSRANYIKKQLLEKTIEEEKKRLG